MTTWIRAALSVVLVLANGCGSFAKIDLGRVITSGRDGWQRPERVIESLAIRPGERVAEIGAGDGYWLPWLSDAVGPSGRVYAVEVEDELVAELRERVERGRLQNVVVVRGGYEDPELPDGEIDLALTCLTYHHIENRPDYFRRLQRDLSPRGRVAHLDDRPDVGWPIRWFQSSGHWSEPAAVRAEMASAGYRQVTEFDFLPAQSFQIFAPTKTAGATSQP
jgi:ubiquinone/menaquinone biosynthesis C-methylase UbiE